MKNARDYEEETSPNTFRINSLAYWLTPEGLNNPIIAELLKDTIESTADEEFKEAFDGATKEEASQYLEQWELCYMAHWGASELARIITLSNEGRNDALAMRAVSLAQSANELPEVFSPTIGIKWAMARGYLITRNICAWVGVQPGNFGHPSNPLPINDSPAAKDESIKGIATQPQVNNDNTSNIIKTRKKYPERRLDALKAWLISLGYPPEDWPIILPKHYTLELVYTELGKFTDQSKEHKGLFTTIELSSFDNFWGKQQKIVELMRGNKSAIL